ncbi:MAG: DUF4340 domain-containing protein [Deltaproteobacteria bacterium]|nr:DUF4340 domain-containing protein [Deltaproteobacteria bacterium]
MSPEPTRQRPKSSATNLILAALLFLVCGFAYWLEIRKKPASHHEEDLKKRLVVIDDNVEAEWLKLHAPDKNVDVELKCVSHCRLSEANAEWVLTSPLSFKADASNVGTFISGVMAMTVHESLPLDGGDLENKLKEFGLDKPMREKHFASIKFKKDAEPYTVYLGDNAAVGENMYVYFTGPGVKSDAVRIVPSYARTNVERSVSYWRSKKLFDFATSEVEGLTLKNPRGTISLAKEGSNWHLAGGQPADNEAVDTYVTGLVFLNAYEYESDNKAKDAAKLGIKPSTPHYTLDIKVAKRSPIRFEVYDFVKDGQPKVYGVLSDKSYIVSLERTAVERFTKKAESFRFHNLLSAAEKEQIGAIKVSFAGKDKYELKLDGGTWKLVSGKIESFDAASVDQALTKLGSARVAEFLGNRPVPAATPLLSSWKLVGKDGQAVREFSAYANLGQGDYYVKLSNGELAKMERGSGSAIPTKAGDFQAQAPVPAATPTTQK